MYIGLGRCPRGSLSFTLVLIVPRSVSYELTVYPRAHRPQLYDQHYLGKTNLD